MSVTQGAVPFWMAEAEHQDYLQRYPAGYNCPFDDTDRVAPRDDANQETQARRTPLRPRV